MKDKTKRELKPLIDGREVGKRWSMKYNTVMRLAWEGRIPCVRIGKCVRFDPDELAELMEKWRS